jgi:N utilization substance protein B
VAKRSGHRRTGRRRAFQILYGLCFTPVENEDAVRRALDDAPLEIVWDPPAKVDEDDEEAPPPVPPSFEDEPVVELSDKAVEFCRRLVLGITRKQEELDERIVSHASNWRISRIAKVELTILRLALYEMLYGDDVPPRVAIDEAVELAKEFGDENSRSFVNGILDAAAKGLAKAAPPQ